MRYRLFTLPLFLISAHIAFANDGSDPTWPCVQPRVDEISAGQMWPYEISEDYELSDEDQRLVSILSLRRVNEEAAKGYVQEFAAAHPELTKGELGAIYDAILSGINLQRGRIISGIARYSEGQQQRSANINGLREKMAAEEGKDDPDFDLLDQMEVDLDWDERIYKDREHSLTYVCETPVILEKRAYMLAQIMAPFGE